MASLYLWHCFNMCIFWSICLLSSGFSVHRRKNISKTWFEDKRGEFNLDSVNFTALHSKKTKFLQGSLRKIRHLPPILWSSICLVCDASRQKAVCTVTHDYQHQICAMLTRQLVNSDALLVPHLSLAACLSPSCLCDLTLYACRTNVRVRLQTALWNSWPVAKATCLQWQPQSDSSQLKSGCFDWSLLLILFSFLEVMFCLLLFK